MFAATSLVTMLASAVVQQPQTSGLASASQPWDSLDTFISAFIEREMEEAHIPGAAFVLVQDGTITLARGYGLASIERATPVDPSETVFRLGSIAKSVTAVAVMQLVESGMIDLDEDVNSYLSRFTIPATYDRPITTFNLLTHTAGFDERYIGQHVDRLEAWQSLGDYLTRRLPRQIAPPGRFILYNDHTTSLAGFLVEEVSGQPYADYVRQHIFEPLGMEHSGFSGAPISNALSSRLATAYYYESGGHRPYAPDYVLTMPAAGLIATAADVGNLMIVLLQRGAFGDRRILQEQTAQALLQRQFGHLPEMPGRGFGFAESRENGRSGFYKDGQATGFRARMFLLPDEGVGFFAVINRSVYDRGGATNRAASFPRLLTSAILDRYFPADTTTDAFRAPEGAADFRARAAEFTGTYRNLWGPRGTVMKMASLFDEVEVADNGDGTIRIGSGRWIEIRPDVFQWADGGPFYRGFHREADHPTHLFIGTGVYGRIPWFVTQRWTIRWMGGFFVVFGGAVLLWIVHRLRSRRTEQSMRPIGSAGAIASLVNLIFLGGIGMVFMTLDPQTMFTGMPAMLPVLLVVPFASTGIMVLALVQTAKSWAARSGTWSGRVFQSLVVLTGLMFIPFLHYWNLLGFRL